MAEGDVPHQTQSSEDTSNNSSSNPSRRHSLRYTRHPNRQHQKVKFSDIAAEEGEDSFEGPVVEQFQGRSIPEIRIPPSEDVADNPLAPPDWTGRTNAAAVQAQSRASRLANRLSNPIAQPRQRSGATTPLSPTPPGKQETPVLVVDSGLC